MEARLDEVIKQGTKKKITMDKKKVKELIQEVIRNNVDSLEFGNDKHNAPLRKANTLLHDALIELSKSDWISVEERLPEYGEKVYVKPKGSPHRQARIRKPHGVGGNHALA